MKNNPKVIKVAIPISINSLFSYSIPDEVAIEDVVGRRVLVNFNNRKIRGYAVSEGEFTDKFPIKEILKVIDKREVFSKDMVSLAFWIAGYYFAGIG